MSTVSAGRVMPLPKGTYDANTTYHVLDIVGYNSSAYIAKATTTGNLPTNTTYWQLIASGSAVASLNDIGNVNIVNPQNGQVIKYNAVTQMYENADDAGGLLPHAVVTAPTGATVTLVKGGTTITATETSTGTFEADIPDYGTYTATATLSGDTATATLAVDQVKIYTLTLAFFSATIAVTYPSGATCTCSATGQPTQTATGSPYTFTVGAAATYTLTCTLDGVSKTETVTITTEGQSETATFAFGTINLTIADEFRSTSITCTDGNVTITKTAPAAGNSMAFYPPTTGTWTISGTYSSQTYSTTATITALATAVSASLALTPDGSTVLPINDVPTWLSCCASTAGSTHTTLSEVLADSTELNALLQDQNACDYLVRCTSSTWTSTLCADENFMQGAGGQNYCSDLLIADSDWLEAIANSEYIDYVLNEKVPTMTSNTTPEGVCSQQTTYDASYAAWKAFDGNDSTEALQNNRVYTGNDASGYLRYQFTSAVAVKLVKFIASRPNTSMTAYAIKASNDGTNFDNITSGTSFTTLAITGNTAYTTWSLELTQRVDSGSSEYLPGAKTLQFYYRQDN